MTATIPSAQLTAITSCELADIALVKAHRALQHPDLEMGGRAVLAPSGLKHLEQIRATLTAINGLVGGGAASAYEL